MEPDTKASRFSRTEGRTNGALVAAVRERISDAVEILGDYDAACAALLLLQWAEGELPLGDLRLSRVEQVDDSVCRVCFQTTTILRLSCGDGMCRPCWADYAASQLRSAQSWRKARCACRSCFIPWKTIWCGDDGFLAENLLVQDFVLCQKGKMCPTPDCSGCYIPDVGSESEEFGASFSVSCPDCHSLWCFACQVEDHSPVSCEMASTWLKTARVVQDTLAQAAAPNPAAEPRTVSTDLNVALVANEIRENSFAPCPSCSVTIEKNSGCMHMTCSSCGFKFCWICFGSLLSHSNSSCIVTAKTLRDRALRIDALRGFEDFHLVQSLDSILTPEVAEQKEDLQKRLTLIQSALPSLTLDDVQLLLTILHVWRSHMESRPRPKFSRDPYIQRSLAQQYNVIRSARTLLAWAAVRDFYGCGSDSQNEIFVNFLNNLTNFVELAQNAYERLQFGSDGLFACLKNWANIEFRQTDAAHFQVLCSSRDGSGRVCSHCDDFESSFVHMHALHRRVCDVKPHWKCPRCTLYNEQSVLQCTSCDWSKDMAICACGLPMPLRVFQHHLENECELRHVYECDCGARVALSERAYHERTCEMLEALQMSLSGDGTMSMFDVMDTGTKLYGY